MRTRALSVLLAASLGGLLFAVPATAQEEDSTVRAVLFFSPTCGHCEYVIQDVLPPLFVTHGGPWEVWFDESLQGSGVPYYLLTNGSLEFLLVDVTVEEGADLFVEFSVAFRIESGGVPRLVVGDDVMIGSAEIPDLLPGIVDEALAGTGIDWPDVPGLGEAVASIPAPGPTTTTTTGGSSTSAPATTVAPTTPTTAAPDPSLPLSDESIVDRFGRDPLANTIAVIVLLGMLASLAAVVILARRETTDREVGPAIPILALVGLGVALYMSTVELGEMDAVCGPVGDCNAVQQSGYARFLGVPVGVIGLVGYVAVLTAWVLQRVRTDRIGEMARTALLGGTLAGVVFSAYLTFLEPFVIGATCAWCLSSAVIVTGLMWLSLRPGLAALRRLRHSSSQLELQLQ